MNCNVLRDEIRNCIWSDVQNKMNLNPHAAEQPALLEDDPLQTSDAATVRMHCYATNGLKRNWRAQIDAL